MSEQVDAIIRKSKKWRDEFDALRAIALASGLDEEVKWGQPCYTLNGSNVFLIHGFKDYCALLFFKGTLMKDPQKVLIQQTANVQSARQIRFTSLKEILKHKSVLKKYIDEAVKVEKSG
ncbi:MAG: DUF1801 domain-containing protein, partial [Bacteroidia bacterium]|nr:DUF1801 domain-containing protein [Bacteroidia bacterium]